MSSHSNHEIRDALVTESPGGGTCCRNGCDYLAEVPVRRFDTGEVRRVCRSCARWLDETVEGIEALGLTDGPPDVGDSWTGPSVTDKEVRLELAIRKHIDGEGTVRSDDLMEDLDVSLGAAAQALVRLEGDAVEPVDDAMGSHKTWRIL